MFKTELRVILHDRWYRRESFLCRSLAGFFSLTLSFSLPRSTFFISAESQRVFGHAWWSIILRTVPIPDCSLSFGLLACISRRNELQLVPPSLLIRHIIIINSRKRVYFISSSICITEKEILSFYSSCFFLVEQMCVVDFKLISWYASLLRSYYVVIQEGR